MTSETCPTVQAWEDAGRPHPYVTFRAGHEAAIQARDTCVWHGDSGTHDTWDTDCHHAFRLEDGTPTDNDMAFCCYCGKPLVTDDAAPDEPEEL